MWVAVGNALVAGFYLGCDWFGDARLFGFVIAAFAIRDWCGYWRARDQFEAWRRSLRK